MCLCTNIKSPDQVFFYFFMPLLYMPSTQQRAALIFLMFLHILNGFQIQLQICTIANTIEKTNTITNSITKTITNTITNTNTQTSDLQLFQTT